MRAAALALFLVASAAWAQEFEIVSSTNTGWTSPSPGFSLDQRLQGSFTQPFDLAGGGLNIKAHVDAGYPSGISGDLDVLSATMVFKNPSADLKSVVWTVGRFGLTDTTGLLLDHPGDGFSLQFVQPGLDLTVFAAYTGWLLRTSSGLTLSKADVAAEDDLLASPRLIGGLSAALPLPAGHHLGLSAWAQQDLNPRSAFLKEWAKRNDEGLGGRLDTQYLTVQGDGPLAQGLFYDAFATFGSGSTLSRIENVESSTGYQYEYRPIVSFLGGLQVQYLLPAVFSSSYSFRVLGASGDEDLDSITEGNTKGWSTAFVPVTATSLGTVFSPTLSNLIVYELGGSLKPLPALPLTTAAKVLGFQRAVAGFVNAPGVTSGGPVWLGQEVDFNVTWKPLSDVSVLASVGAFIPTAGTFAAGSPGAGFQSAVKVGATLSL